MRKYLLIFIFLLSGYSGHSQVLISLLLGDVLNTGKVEFGLDGGLNLSTISGVDHGNYSPDFNLGFYFDIKMKNPSWLFHTGVIVKSAMGIDNLPVYSLNDEALDNAFTGGSVDRKLKYFNVPFMMKYKLSKSFYVEGGPMLALRTKCFDTFKNKVKESDDLTYKLEISDNYHRIDAGLIGGVGYRLMGGNGMNLGVRYYMGLMDILIDNPGSAQYNRSIYFVVGIPIGAGKAKKKQEAEAN
jgi:hypothetical protein